MNVNGRREILRLIMLANDDDCELVLFVLFHWRRLTSHFITWLIWKRLTLQRFVAERRIGLYNFVHEILPAYHNVQFQENFRMARATFEVKTEKEKPVTFV